MKNIEKFSDETKAFISYIKRMFSWISEDNISEHFEFMNNRMPSKLELIELRERVIKEGMMALREFAND